MQRSPEEAEELRRWLEQNVQQRDGETYAELVRRRKEAAKTFVPSGRIRQIAEPEPATRNRHPKTRKGTVSKKW